MFVSTQKTNSYEMHIAPSYFCFCMRFQLILSTSGLDKRWYHFSLKIMMTATIGLVKSIVNDMLARRPWFYDHEKPMVIAIVFNKKNPILNWYLILLLVIVLLHRFRAWCCARAMRRTTTEKTSVWAVCTR